MRKLSILCVSLVQAALAATPEVQPRAKTFEVLDRSSESVQALAARVAPSVVQITVDRYRSAATGTDRTSEDSGSMQSIGSGVIVDPSGYIVTNAHVVEDARRIRVKLTPPPAGDEDAPSISAALNQSLVPARDATLVGVFKEGDLALLKIAATSLPALPFADYKSLRQGQVVFAFGSRQGLHDSVSMGVVSSVARQLATDSPFIYIQTDAAINPGDSGGPLINTAGEIVGLDTFILSKSGGSEGMGFAVPSPLVELVANDLRKYGHFHRQLIGVGVQSITPPMAAALHLPRSSGVIITDIAAEGPADSAGLHLNDIVLSVDGRPVKNLPLFMMSLLVPPDGRPLTLDVLRGDQSLSIRVTPVEESHKTDHVTDLIDPAHSELPELGVLGITVGEKNASTFPELRVSTGIYVAAWSRASGSRDGDLEIGDVIHGINGTGVKTLEELQTALHAAKPGDPVALWIERERKMQYVTFERE